MQKAPLQHTFLGITLYTRQRDVYMYENMFEKALKISKKVEKGLWPIIKGQTITLCY